MLLLRARAKCTVTSFSAWRSSYRSFSDDVKRQITRINVLYGSQTGTAMGIAHQVHRYVRKKRKKQFKSSVLSLKDTQYESLVSMNDTDISVNVFVVACFGSGEPTDDATRFYEWLTDTKRQNEPQFFNNVHYCVFGLGQSVHYPENYQAVGKEFDARLLELGARRITERGEGDDAHDLDDDFEKWHQEFWERIDALNSGEVEWPAPKEPNDDGDAGGDDSEGKKLELDTSSSSAAAAVDADKSVGTSHDEGDTMTAPSTVSPDLVSVVDGFFPELEAIRLLTVSVNISGKHSFSEPTNMSLSKNEELYDPSSGRSCRHLEFPTNGDQKLRYWCGDYLGVFPRNRVDMVDALCTRLKLDPNVSIDLNDYPVVHQSPVSGHHEHDTLRNVLLNYFDLTSPVPASSLRDIAKYAASQSDREKLEFLAQRNLVAKEDYTNFVENGHLAPLDILMCFPSISGVPVDFLLDHLKPLSPRFYSIASSPVTDPDSIHACVSVVKYRNGAGRESFGVCSNFLEQCSPQSLVSAFVKHSTFRLVPMVYHPIIMIGAGTGIAPFRGFLRERVHYYEEHGASSSPFVKTRHQLHVNQANLLVWGCTSRSGTFLYREELEKYEKQGYLTMHLAFSRDQPYRRYVQHVLLDENVGADVWRRIHEHRAMVYICGDIAGMAPGVHEALILIGMKHGGLSHAESARYFHDLLQQGRYLLDIY